MALSFDVSPSTALIRGYDRLLMRLTNWGNTGPSADAESINTGVQNFSVAGVAIDPQSDYQEVLIQSTVTLAYQSITPGNPFVGDIPGPWRGSATTAQWWNDNYYPTGTTTNAPFGYSMGADPNGRAIFGGRSGSLLTPQYPELRLILYLRPANNFPLGLTPLYDDGGNMTIDNTFVNLTVVRCLYVGGRRNLRVVFKRGSGAGSLDVQLTALRDYIAPGNKIEFELGAAQTMALPSSELDITQDITNISWVFIKAKYNAGVPGPTLSWILRAE